MSTQKIPDKSNLLEKISVVKDYLDGNTSKPKTADEEENNFIDSSTPVENTIVESISLDNTQQPALQIEEEPRQVIKCTNCGANRNSEHVFCFNCGQRYEELNISNGSGHTTLQHAEEPIPLSVILQCPNCQTPYETEDVFCMNCGNKL